MLPLNNQVERMRKYFKIVSGVVLFLQMIALFYGINTIYSYAENIENSTNVFLASTNQKLTGVKYNEKVQNSAKKAAENILGNGIKFKASEFCGEEDKIVCYTKNVYMELNINSMQPQFIVYECSIGNASKSNVECETAVERFVFRNMPRKAKAKNAEIHCDSFNDKTAEYHLNFANGTVWAAVRRDTGTVIYYDASELFL